MLTPFRWLQGTTGPAYLKWTAANKIAPKSIVLPDKSEAFWIGDDEADTVVLYFHGGGWAVPAGDGHFNFLAGINAAAARSGRSLAFLLLQYDLAPGKQYPHQLRQCAELLRYATKQFSGKRLMRGGDSAGGNLVFGLLQHVLRPHPEIEPVSLQSPLRAAFTASPWLDFDMSSDRFKGNEAYDAASVQTLKTWARHYVGTSKTDEWREPAKSQNWSGLGKVVDDILITVAKNEVMADDVQHMVSRVEVQSRPSSLCYTAADTSSEVI